MRSISSDDAASGFSTSTCLPASSAATARSACVAGRRGDDHGIDRVVVQDLLEVGGAAHLRVAAPRQLERRLAAVAAPHELGVAVLDRDAGEVRSPVAEADEGDADGLAHGTALAFSAPTASRTAAGHALGVLERRGAGPWAAKAPRRPAARRPAGRSAANPAAYAPVRCGGIG